MSGGGGEHGGRAVGARAHAATGRLGGRAGGGGGARRAAGPGRRRAADRRAQPLRARPEGDHGHRHGDHRPAQHHAQPWRLLLLLRRVQRAGARGRENVRGPQRRLVAGGVAEAHRRPVDQAGPHLVPQPALRAQPHHHADLRGAGREAARQGRHPGRPRLRELRRLRRRGSRSQHRRGRGPDVDDASTRRATTSPRREKGADHHPHGHDQQRRRRVLGRGVAARPEAHRRAQPSRSTASRCCSTASRTTRAGAGSSRGRSPRASRPWRSWSARSGPAAWSASARTPRPRCAATTGGSTPPTTRSSSASSSTPT